MRALTRQIGHVASIVAASTALFVVAPVIASAEVTVATGQCQSCGYDGYTGSNGSQPLYTHCGRGRVEIEVDHFFWQKTYFCAGSGTQEIPQGSSQWRIIGAEYDGKSC
jgi:hypothetical protein